MPDINDEVDGNVNLGDIPIVDRDSNVIDDDGFQKVLSISERRSLKKKVSKLLDEKRITPSECIKKESSIKSRLKKRGIIVKDLDESMIKDSTIDDDELNMYISELDDAIDGILIDIIKPDQNMSILELENKIKDAKNKLSKMKSKDKLKDGGDVAFKEVEMYISYLQDQLMILREYQRIKSIQISLMKLRSTCKDILNIKKKLKNKIEKVQSQPVKTTTITSEFLYNTINDYKRKNNKELIDANDIYTGYFRIYDKENRFQYPFNYLQRIKNMFTVHIERLSTSLNEGQKIVPFQTSLNEGQKIVPFQTSLNEAYTEHRPSSLRSSATPPTSSSLSSSHLLVIYGLRTDVEKCIEYLSSLDLDSSSRIQMSFTRYKDLMDIQERFNVLTFYYSGQLDIIGKGINVKNAIEYINERSCIVEDNENIYSREDNYLILKALSTKFKSLIRKLEEDYNVDVKLEFNNNKGRLYIIDRSRGDDGNGRSNNDNLHDNSHSNDKSTSNTSNNNPSTSNTSASASASASNAMTTVIKLMDGIINDFTFIELKNITNDEILFLSDNDIQRKRYKSQYTCIIKYNDKIYIVGYKNFINFGYNRALELIKSKNIQPFKFNIINYKINIILQHINNIENNIGSYIIDYKDHLLIYGTDEQINNTINYINNILNDHNLIKKNITPLQYTLLNDNKSYLLHTLEIKFNVNLKIYDKKILHISGNINNTQYCLNEINKIFQSIVTLSLNQPINITPPEVQSNPLPLAVEASSNYLPVNGNATPGDRGEDNVEEQRMSTPKNEDVQLGRTGNLPGGTENVNPEERDGEKWVGPQVETSSGTPGSDLRELEGELNREGRLQDNDRTPSGEAVYKTTSDGTVSGKTSDVEGSLVDIVSGLFYGSLEVSGSSMSRIIGKGGSNMRYLINKSGVVNISTCGNILLIHGNRRSISNAVDLIGQIISSDEDITKLNITNESIYEEYTSKNSFIRKHANAKTKQRNVEQQQQQQATSINIDPNDHGNFPALS